ncbi:MAG: glutathione S-transferase family protein [Gammaproteobacteria bacterium]
MSDLVLFHNGPSTCSQKVRLILGLKNLPYESKIIDLQAGEQHNEDYVKINPNHVVPTLLFKGNPIIESSLILEFLEDQFPEISARPNDAEALHKTRLWLKTTDAYQVHGGSITYGIAVRNILILKPKDELEREINEIPNAERRDNRRDLIENGLKAECVIQGLLESKKLMDKLENGLDDSDWFTGTNFGIADAAIFPYVLRWEQLTLSRYCNEKSHPKLNDWFNKVRKLPFYEEQILSFLPLPLIDALKQFSSNQKDELDEIFASF